MNDIIFHRYNSIFNYRVTAILVHNDRVLLQTPKNMGEYAFPDGHVALGDISKCT